MSREGYNYKRKALSIAKDFGYSEEVRNMIATSKSEDEISWIMTNARKGILK